MSVKVSCPGCGGPIEFKVGSAIVAVCPYCRSVVARGDRKIEDLGKVAALADTDSQLEVGLKGRYQGVPFYLTGRTQLGHQAGGTWDEWYAAFSDGRWGWLAEAMGRYFITFEQEEAADLPPLKELQLGEQIRVPGAADALTVSEKGKARVISAEGEIPFRLDPGATYRYADCSGPNAEFATLDYGENPPTVYVGREVTLDDLAIPPRAKPAGHELREVEGKQLNCPHCGAALALHAPDKAERVTCPSCRSLLDIHQGNLIFLKALETPEIEPILPLGATGKLGETEYVNIGFLQRSVTIEGVKCSWEEYLLYHPREGFRWLVRSDEHWNFVESLPPGNVKKAGRYATYEGKQYKLFQRAWAEVENVQGEFYWKVEVGEQVRASDFINPPDILSREVTRSEDDDEERGEINWSHGTYLPVAEVEQAFGIQGIPRPAFMNVAPNQPFPYGGIYKYWAIIAGIAFLLFLFVLLINPRRKVFERDYQAVVGNVEQQAKVILDENDTFELRGWRNIRVTVSTTLQNAGVDVIGDLINVQTDQAQPFEVTVGYWQGVEDGESWTEDEREKSVYLSSVPSGQYMLRLELLGEHPNQPTTIHVKLEQGVARFLPWFITLIIVSAIPLAIGGYHLYFNQKRWENSSID
jgi:Zn finger protein HypA/HybF involved in hydrogenase expression